MICQATRTEPATITVPSQSPDGPYHLCVSAAERLNDFALRPMEWFNLAAIHGPFEFLLHDDFYTEDGHADQPKRAVVDAEKFPCPTLQECAPDALRLLDFAITRWWLEDDVVREFQRHDGALLELIAGRFDRTKNGFIQCRLAAIAGRALGQRAAEWFRRVTAGMSVEDRLAMLNAGYACLPPMDGIEAAKQALACVPAARLFSECLLLARFRDASVLDWMESNVQDPLTHQWGDLAAASGLDWDRAARWLKGGRPLSLVALDALIVCAGPQRNQAMLIQRMDLRLQNAPSARTLETAVTEYAKHDKVLRVERAVAQILKSLGSICRSDQDRQV